MSLKFFSKTIFRELLLGPVYLWMSTPTCLLSRVFTALMYANMIHGCHRGVQGRPLPLWAGFFCSWKSAGHQQLDFSENQRVHVLVCTYTSRWSAASFSRKGFCRNPREISLNKFPGEFCGGFFGGFWGVSLTKRGKIHPKIHSRLQIRIWELRSQNPHCKLPRQGMAAWVASSTCCLPLAWHAMLWLHGNICWALCCLCRHDLPSSVIDVRVWLWLISTSSTRFESWICPFCGCMSNWRVACAEWVLSWASFPLMLLCKHKVIPKSLSSRAATQSIFVDINLVWVMIVRAWLKEIGGQGSPLYMLRRRGGWKRRAGQIKDPIFDQLCFSDFLVFRVCYQTPKMRSCLLTGSPFLKQ